MARMLTQNVLTSLHGTFGAAPFTCPYQRGAHRCRVCAVHMHAGHRFLEWRPL